MENEMIYALAAFLGWWTFAVVSFSLLVSTGDRVSVKDAIGCALWPLLLLPVLIMLTYWACIKSTAQLKADLHNRKLLREFEQWLKDREE